MSARNASERADGVEVALVRNVEGDLGQSLLSGPRTRMVNRHDRFPQDAGEETRFRHTTQETLTDARESGPTLQGQECRKQILAGIAVAMVARLRNQSSEFSGQAMFVGVNSGHRRTGAGESDVYSVDAADATTDFRSFPTW